MCPADYLRRLILQCSVLSIISTSSRKDRWFPFSFHIWSAISDFSISPRTTAFRCSSSLTFSERPVSPLYILPQLPKRCGNNNKDEDNSPKTLNDKNHKVSSQKFRQQTPEEGRRIYRPKRCGNNNKDEGNSPKTLNDKNHQVSSQKFRQLLSLCSNDFEKLV